jgi:hemerythrin-like metal-binding protein
MGPAMQNRVNWEADYSVGDAALDAQHREILARCEGLADCLAAGGAQGERRFDQAFEQLAALAREHFAAEEALLARRGYPGIEDYRGECAEFDYLSGEIVTTENFDRRELQAFLALWWTGHILEAARNHRACLGPPAP